jgi:hypothetical protein
MPHPADDPRVQQLLREADEAVQRRADPATLAALHMHLGMVFHEVVRRAAAQARAADPTVARQAPLLPSTTPDATMLPDDDAEPSEPLAWTNEIERDEGGGGWTEDSEVPEGPLFDSGELDENTNFPENADADGFDLETAEHWPEGPSAFQLPADLRTLLALPPDLTSPDDLAVEASRVQWATSDLDGRFGGLPPPSLSAVLGLLSARANLLSERLDVAVGPRLAIDRLRRWRAAHGLPQVAGLEENPLPERGSWEADTRSWWAVFEGATTADGTSG